ncbi:MAG: response regulator [Celeribacter sp.]|jgi:two-component system nitrogen regulation response regulator GlnG
MDGTVLVADDDRTIRTVLTQALTRAGCKVHATSSLVTLMRWVEEGKGDLVISDVMMPDGNGLEMLPKISEERPGLPVIVISAQNTIMTAIQAAEADAYDYLPKPFDLPDLMKRAARALETKRRAASQRIDSAARAAAQGSAIAAAAEQGEDLPLVGRTPLMQALYRLVARVMNTDLPVLITGESGTGKSLIARAIHDFSDRRTLPFVVASAADLAGADGPASVVARARGGSILFDEVGDLDADAQARIVRMLDTFGDTAPRVMATSQGDLMQRMESGNFRQDLFYRLGGVAVAVPSLRERVDDIPLLSEHFLARAERDGMPLRRFSNGAMDLVRAYSWPGNVRQLENTIRRLVVTSAEEEIGRSEVELVLGNQPAIEPLVGGGEGEKLSASVGKHLRRYFDLHGGVLPPPGLYQRILKEVEMPLIEIALDATGGNQAKCADLLGINRNTLRKKITDLDIRVTRRRKLM